MTEVTIPQIDDFQFAQDIREVDAIVRELRDSAAWELENGGDEAKAERLTGIADALARMMEVYKSARLGLVVERKTERRINLNRWG